MNSGPGNEHDDPSLRWALKQAALRNHRYRRLEGTGDGLLVPRAQPSPEHYHVVYNIPSDNISIPHYTDVYVSAREAYQKLFEMGKAAEPRCEFYEDGKVGIETRLYGRADLWWIVLEVAACIRSACMDRIQREKLKRQLLIVPEAAL